MKKFLDNNVTAIMTIVILAVGSISGVGMAQFVIGSDGSLLSNILGGCIYGACKDTKVTGNFTNGTLAGCIYGACKNVEITGQGQPTPNPPPTTGTLIVIKSVECPSGCPAGLDFRDFVIEVSNPFPKVVSQFHPCDTATSCPTTGTKVTLNPGEFFVEETNLGSSGNSVKISGDCQQSTGAGAEGTIKAGET